jgi:hypothetical protein
VLVAGRVLGDVTTALLVCFVFGPDSSEVWTGAKRVIPADGEVLKVEDPHV